MTKITQEVEIDLTPEILAKAFACMGSDEQAAFFAHAHHEMGQYVRGATGGALGEYGRNLQVAFIVPELDKKGADLIDELFQMLHMDEEPEGITFSVERPVPDVVEARNILNYIDNHHPDLVQEFAREEPSVPHGTNDCDIFFIDPKTGEQRRVGRAKNFQIQSAAAEQHMSALAKMNPGGQTVMHDEVEFTIADDAALIERLKAMPPHKYARRAESNPIDDIRRAKEEIAANMIIPPNILIMGKSAGTAVEKMLAEDPDCVKRAMERTNVPSYRILIDDPHLAENDEGFARITSITDTELTLDSGHVLTDVTPAECDECFGTGLTGGFQGACSHGCKVKS